VVAELDLAGDELEPTCNAISHGSLMGARGNSGVILSQSFAAWSASSKKLRRARPPSRRGLEGGMLAAYQAVLKPIEGTILTVARESADAATAAAADGASLVVVLRAARTAGRTALTTPRSSCRC